MALSRSQLYFSNFRHFEAGSGTDPLFLVIIFDHQLLGLILMGKCLKSFLRFPWFETYVPHEKEEEHIEDVITESEINALEKKEMKFKEKQ